MRKNYNWINHLFNFLGVILGVFLAFFVSEQAKEAEDKKEIQLLIQSMINDLSDDIKAYEEYHIPVNTQYNENLDSMLFHLLNNNIAATNSLLPSLFQIENFIPNASVYNSIKSSGKIKLLDDLEIQKQLSDFYDGTAIECSEKSKIQVSYFIDEVVKWLVGNADLAQMKLLNEEELVVFRNTIMIYSSLVDQKVKNYHMIVDEANLLKEQLSALSK